MTHRHRPAVVVYTRPWWRGWRRTFWAYCTGCGEPAGPFDTREAAVTHTDELRRRDLEALFPPS